MIRDRLEIIVKEALEALGAKPGAIVIERPTDSTHGDFATNAALVYAKELKTSPRDLAGKIVEEILKTSSEEIEKLEVAGPGFINFFLTTTALENAFQNDRIPAVGNHEKVNVEFISANPTGELHIGHGRGAFYGDILSRVLSVAGYDVTREFYINDSRESNQIKELGKTALGKGEQYKTPELIEKMEGMDFSGMTEEEAGVALAQVVGASNRQFIEEGLKVPFDVWYSEDKELRASGLNDATLIHLKEASLTYEKDGALWLKTSDFGDDEDRVVVRSTGTMTYVVSDIAYHQMKFDRGFQTVINVWGADHHGHVKRMQAIGRMLGWPKAPRGDADQPIVFIVQMVSLKEDGVSKKMSKRAGNVILLRDLVEELGVDVVRWFFAEKALTTQMVFDMAVARDQSDKNPVFYVQYANARIASILEKTKSLTESEGTSFADLIKIPSARALVMKSLELPEVVVDVSKTYGVQALTSYATELAVAMNAYYRDVRIINGEVYDVGALKLLLDARTKLLATLDLLGISAPEKM